MKAIVFLLFLLSSLSIIAQDSIPDPEFNMRPYYFDGNELKNLERVKGQVDSKAKGLYGGASVYYATFGDRSSVRFSTDDLPRIIVKFDPAETFGMKMDPLEVFQISKAVEGKGKKDKERRLFETVSVDHFGRTKDISSNIIIFDVKKISDISYEIIFPNGLEPGEYAIVQGIDLTCFGID